MPRDTGPTQRELRDQAVAVLLSFAERDRHFTIEQLRETLGIAPKGKESTRLWNVWRQLQDAGVVEDTTPGRDRHRIFRVASLEKLQAMQPISVKRRRAVSQRSVEAQLASLESRVAELESKLRSLAK